jgi:hypothetical protein
MAYQQTRHRCHAEVRPRSQIPLPAVDAVEQRLRDVLRPAWLAPRQLERRAPRPPQRRMRMRQRRLTWPVSVAIMVSLGWRRVPSLAAVQKVLTRDGVWGVSPLQGSPQALTTRLDVLPAAVMGQLCAEVWTRVQAQAPPPRPHPRWAPTRARFPGRAMVAGATRAALGQTTAGWRERTGRVWAGTMRGLVAACRHRPRWQLDTADAAAPDQRGAAASLAALSGGGLVVWALGFGRLLWCEDVTDPPQGWVTRRREKTAYRTVHALSGGPYDRDESSQVGP